MYKILNLNVKVLKYKGIRKLQKCNEKIRNNKSAPRLKQHFTVLMIKVMIPSGKVLFSASEIISPCCAFHFFLTAVMNDFFWTAIKYKLAEWLCELLSDTL